MKLLNAMKIFQYLPTPRHRRTCNMAFSFSFLSYSCQVSIAIGILLRCILSDKYLLVELEPETMPEFNDDGCPDDRVLIPGTENCECKDNTMEDSITGKCVEYIVDLPPPVYIDDLPPPHPNATSPKPPTPFRRPPTPKAKKAKKQVNQREPELEDDDVPEASSKKKGLRSSGMINLKKLIPTIKCYIILALAISHSF